MVVGVDKFAEALGQYNENYIIIGGTACDLILTSLNYEPRATMDIDMIVVVEKMNAEFATAFWAFIREGGYHPGKRLSKQGENVYAFYRFDEPTNPAYPSQIELLSRHSELLGEPSGFHIEPIPLETELSSLSAIIMNEDIYHFTVEHGRDMDNLHVADAPSLVVLKSAAYMNLLRDKQNGLHVNERDLRKHRTDVVRLLLAETWNEPIAVPASIHDILVQFTEEMRANNLQSLSSAIGQPEVIVQALLNILTERFSLE